MKDAPPSGTNRPAGRQETTPTTPKEHPVSSTAYRAPVTPVGDLVLLHAVATVHIDPDAATGEQCGQCRNARRALPVEARVLAADENVAVDACMPCAALVAAAYRAIYGPDEHIVVTLAPDPSTAAA